MSTVANKGHAPLLLVMLLEKKAYLAFFKLHIINVKSLFIDLIMFLDLFFAL